MKPMSKSKMVHMQPKAKKPRAKRKGPHEFRSISRAHKVKDGRPVLLSFRDPRDDGKRTTHECWFCRVTGKWWLANMAPDLPGCDAAEELYGAPLAWLPMPQDQSTTEAVNLVDSPQVVSISDFKASKNNPLRRAMPRKGEAEQQIQAKHEREVAHA